MKQTASTFMKNAGAMKNANRAKEILQQVGIKPCLTI
jgi:hypothetical protein